MKRLNYHDIYILDNASTYSPLLEWYTTKPCTVIRLEHNLGQLAVYNSDYINKFEGWIAYTDSDIELNPNTPTGFIERMIAVARKYDKIKAGLALRIDDLPDTDYGRKARWWEQQYWIKQVEEGIYDANVDTTFSTIIVGQPFTYDAVRIAGNFIAKHVPWYLDYSNLSEEEQYILDHSDSEFSTTKRFTNSCKAESTLSETK